ncbi:MAG: hypothetical protein RL226_974, partial [Bacteroidota bacterium]
FYYREYERDMSDPNPDNWKHIERHTPFQMRGRFTPTSEGQWWVEARIITKGETMKVSKTSFTVVGSNLPGFVEVGTSKRFLSRDGKTLFPVGQNLPWPSCHKDFDSTCTKIYCAGSEAWCHSRIMGPYGFEVYEREMQALADAGGTWFRMLIAPWNLEIEFEELNNYYDRLHCAWETDRILENAQKMNLLVQFNLQVHYPLENPSSYSMLQWDFGDLPCYPWDNPYCYADELNLKEPIDFLRSKEAQYHYKNRLRYLIARYGYSTSIAVMELFSEANNINNDPNVSEDCVVGAGEPKLPYYNRNNELPPAISQWQKEMTSFIKSGLNHRDHLLGVSYTGLPSFTRGDSSFYHPSVDVACWNDYTIAVNKYSRSLDLVHNFQDKRQRGKFTNFDPPAIGKPMMLSETGPGIAEIEYCDGNIRWIKAAWLSTFTGMAATPANWSMDHHPDLWKHFRNIHLFMKDIPLDEEAWESVKEVRKDNKAEVLALRSGSGENRLIGAVHNKTVNFYTRRTGEDPCGNLDVVGLYMPDELRKAETLTSGKGSKKLALSSLGPFSNYTIEWIDPLSLKVVQKTEKSASLSGKLVLDFPDLSSDGLPFLLFRIYRTKFGW